MTRECAGRNCLYLWWCNKNNCWCPFSVHISEGHKVHFFHFDQRASMKRFVLKKSSQETYKQMHLMFIFLFFVFGQIQTGIETHGSCIESHCELVTF